MTKEQLMAELLAFFRALSDPSRLKIIGLLAQDPLSVEQIAEMLNLHPSTVSHHMSRLAKAGLVQARAEGYYSIYELKTKVLEDMARQLLKRETFPSFAADVDLDAYDRKVLKNYLTADGKIKSFPVQQKKMEAILHYVVQSFEMDKRYPEKELNQILLRFSEDTARIRRSLVEFHLMDRQGGGGDYWRI